MEDYPEEMRSPPVSLVAVAGCPELHQAISAHLHSLQPPINTLALPDLSKISLLIAPNPKDDQSSNPDPVASSGSAGILKRDWLLKHRTKIPAVVAAFFSSDCVSGDPAQWLQLCSDLDNLKAVIRARNIILVLVVVHSHSKDDITEDRMLALRKRAEIDSKYFVTFAQNDDSELKQSLHRLGSIFAELASTYYRDEGRRIKTRIEKKSFRSIELHVRYCFKVAVYAEFRRDWVEAIRFYEDAYHTVREKRRNDLYKPDQEWVQCDKCRKWRMLSCDFDSKNLPLEWFCHMKPFKQCCEIPKQKIASGVITVSAKRSGYDYSVSIIPGGGVWSLKPYPNKHLSHKKTKGSFLSSSLFWRERERERMADSKNGESSLRCHHCAGPLTKEMETSDWTVQPFIRDSFSMIGSAVGGTTSAFYRFNHVMPVVRKWVKGPMWLHFLIGAPPVIVFSSACAGLAGGAVPAVAQLASSSYYATFSSSSLPPTSQDDKIHKSRTSSTL